MRIVIKGRMRGESCEDVVYAIVYGMRVIIGPIRECYSIVQKVGSKRDLKDRMDAANTLPLGGVERSRRIIKCALMCGFFVRGGFVLS